MRLRVTEKKTENRGKIERDKEKGIERQEGVKRYSTVVEKEKERERENERVYGWL